MRVHAAIAILCLGTATAGAADLPLAPAAGGYGIYGERAGMIAVYDTEPGVTVRAYWRNPWRNRHYFPVGKDEPRVVRTGGTPKRAESYYRYWSNDEHIELMRRRYDVRPPADKPPQDIPLK